MGFVESPRDFFGFWFLAPFELSCPLKSGVSPLGKKPVPLGRQMPRLIYGTNPPPPLRRKASIPTKYLTFQYTKFFSCHATGVKKGFIKGEARRLLRIPLKPLLRKISKNFENRPIERGYPCLYCQKVPLRGKSRRQEDSSLTEKQIRP